MNTRRLTATVLPLLAVTLVLPLAAQPPVHEPIDQIALARLREEAFTRSAVIETASYLTDVFGPRLTGSPNLKAATEWAQTRMKRWGFANVHRERFLFGPGWQNHRFVAAVVSPRAHSLIGAPKAWSPGTNGPITANVVHAVVTTTEDFDTWRGRLHGKFVLAASVRPVLPRFAPMEWRLTPRDLEALAQPLPSAFDPDWMSRERAEQQEFERRRLQFFANEGVVALVEPSPLGEAGTYYVQSTFADGAHGQRMPQLPQVVLTIEHYGRIVRILEKGIPVSLQLDIDNRFYANDPYAFNLVAEITGTDKADEIVMLGAHLDSWHAGTGATDNAAGVAIMMEAMRILKASGTKLRRTVRLALWSGEEQGLLGSRAYVAAHFADPRTMQTTPDHDRVSAYFNLDNGTGAIRGVYLEDNLAVAPIFQRWMEPFRGGGMVTVAPGSAGESDHLAYEAVGIPGFEFIQDPLDYYTRTHHSNQDVFERIQEEEMKRNAVIVASFALQTANRDERLPRKPLPQPSPLQGVQN